MTDELYRVLLNQLTGGAAAAESAAGISELVNQMIGSDPRHQLIKQYLSQRQTPLQENYIQPQRIGKGEAQTVQRLRKETQALTRELQNLQERNDSLAAALGACYLCWGEEPTCSHCRGRGRPGYVAPDKELFIEWVAPAVRTLKTHSGTVKGSSTLIRQGDQNE